MDYEQLILNIGIQPLQLYLGLAMGLAFGIGASMSNFCLRGFVLDLSTFKFTSTSYTWLLGLAIAITFTQLLLQGDASDISEAPVIAVQASLSGSIVGGLMFGFGMILSRGCVSRQIILITTGNLRSLVTFGTFAVFAQLTYGGQLVSFRQSVQELWRLNPSYNQVHDFVPFSPTLFLFISASIALVCLVMLIKRQAWSHLMGGTIVGLAIALGWYVTSFVAYHTFNDILPQSITFSAPTAQSLIALMSVDAPFIRLAAGLVAGFFLGALIVSLIRQDFNLQSFTQKLPIRRYLLAGMLMGVGSVLASGCSVGAGLSGTAVMATGSIVTLIFIIIGGLISTRYSA